MHKQFSKKDIERARLHATKTGTAFKERIPQIKMSLGETLISKAKKYKGFKII